MYKNLLCRTIILNATTRKCFFVFYEGIVHFLFPKIIFRNVWIIKAKSTKTRTVIFAWSLLWASVIWLFYSVSSPVPSVSAARCCWHSDGHHSAYANLKHTTGTSHQGHSHIEASGIFLLLHGSCTWCMICKGFI